MASLPLPFLAAKGPGTNMVVFSQGQIGLYSGQPSRWLFEKQNQPVFTSRAVTFPCSNSCDFRPSGQGSLVFCSDLGLLVSGLVHLWIISLTGLRLWREFCKWVCGFKSESFFFFFIPFGDAKDWTHGLVHAAYTLHHSTTQPHG